MAEWVEHWRRQWCVVNRQFGEEHNILWCLYAVPGILSM